MEQQKAAAEAAVTAGVAEVTERIKNDLRGQVTGAGLGNKLAKSWQAKLYPKGQKSISAAGWVFSKAPKLIRAFNEGALIKSKDGFFLAIPTEAAPKRGVGGKRINPSNFPEHSLGRLRFVYRPGKISLLVVDSLRASTGKRGGFRKASESALKSGRGLTTVVMFLLVPQVKLKKRLDYQSVVNRWEGQLPQTILKNWKEVSPNAEQT
ncbi:MAG: DUF6441 family protein [Alphaproteobacteria bacterium]